MKINQKLRPGFTLVELLVVIVIIAALAGLAAPQVIKMRKKGDLAEATSNGRQLGLTLAQFDADIGGYPDNDTETAISDLTGETVSNASGNDSNSYFRQLILSGATDSEQPFFAKTSYSKRKPDDVTQPTATKMLEAGEVGFGYIMGSSDTALGVVSGRPICVTPLQPGNTDGTMEYDPYDGKAIALFTDYSVRQLNIPKAGTNQNKAMLPGGKTLTSVGNGSIWDSLPDGQTPTIKPPARN